MAGIWLLLLFLIVRFGLLAIIKREAIQRAAYFAPLQKSEKIAYYIYQVSNIGLFICLIVSSVKIDDSLLLRNCLFYSRYPIMCNFSCMLRIARY